MNSEKSIIYDRRNEVKIDRFFQAYFLTPHEAEKLRFDLSLIYYLQCFLNNPPKNMNRERLALHLKQAMNRLNFRLQFALKHLWEGSICCFEKFWMLVKNSEVLYHSCLFVSSVIYRKICI